MDTTDRSTAFATVEEAIEDIRHGRFVVVVDAADRENEGDLTIAAQFATPEAINPWMPIMLLSNSEKTWCVAPGPPEP